MLHISKVYVSIKYPLYIPLSYPIRVVQYAFEPSLQEPHTVSS